MGQCILLMMMILHKLNIDLKVIIIHEVNLRAPLLVTMLVIHDYQLLKKSTNASLIATDPVTAVLLAERQSG